MKHTPYFLRHALAFCSLCLLSLFSTTALAQEEDQAGNLADSTRLPTPKRIGLGFDYSKLVTLAMASRTQYEGNLQVLVLRRVGLAVEGGWASLSPEVAYKNGSYTSEGYYVRAGIDVLLPMQAAKNMSYLGVRYGINQFYDEPIVTVASTLWPNYTYEGGKREGLQASWFEVVFGTEGQVVGPLYLGWMARGRFGLNFDNNQGAAPVYIMPGYGLADKKFNVAMNLHARLRF